MKRLLSVIYLLVGLCSLLLAQRPVEIHYTHADGLFTNEVIYVKADLEGRIWVNYAFFDRFSRFDGVKWEHWDLMEEGISGNFQLLAGDKNGFWLKGKTEVLRHCNEGEWHKKDIARYYPFFHPVYDQIVFLEEETGQVYSFDAEHKDSLSSLNLSFEFSPLKSDAHGIRIIHFNNEMILLRIYIINSIKYIEKYELSTGIKLNKIKSPSILNRAFVDQNHLFLWEDANLKVLKNDELIPFDYKTKEGKNFINVAGFSAKTDKGWTNLHRVKESIPNQSPRYHYLKLNENLEAEIFMENIHRSANNSIAVLPNGDQVYASGAGLIHRKNGILHLSDEDYPMVAGLHMIAEDGDGNIWFGGYEGEGGFAFFDGNKTRKPADPALQRGRILPGSYTDKKGRIFFFEERIYGLHTIENGVRKELNFWDFPLRGFFIKQLRNGWMGLGTNRLGFMKFDPENPSDYYLVGEEQGLDFHNILCFDEDKYGRLWMGRTSMGVAAYCFDNQLLGKWYRNNIEALSDGAMAILIDSAQQLWVGGNKGLYYLKDPHLYDLENGNIFDDWKKVNLPGPENQMINCILENDSFIIVGSDYAIHFIPKNQDFESIVYPFIHSLSFDKEIPGISSEQNAILKDSRGYLWLGTDEGALRFDMNLLQFDQSTTELSLTKAVAGSQNLDVSRENLTLPSGARSLDLQWSSRGNELLQDNIYFRVSLFGKNGTPFYQTHSRSMTTLINYIPPGNYRLRLEAIKNNQVNQYMEKSILVPYLWFENPLHIVGLTLFGIAILILIYSMQNKQRRLEAEKIALIEKNQTQMDQLRVKALSNYFNPHFINNVLHWIQSKYRKDPETTEIVGKLAENVHFLFHNTMAEKKAHELRKELKIIDNYVSIALTRFGDIFEYRKKIEVEEDTLDLVKIPNLLLQIHVENAIEKGIRGHTDFGLLEISIKEDEKTVFVEILDNGIGRNKNNETVLLERKSSTKVMEEMLEILNKNNELPIKITYEDNCIKADTTSKKDHGTRVIISIPKNYNYGQ